MKKNYVITGLPHHCLTAKCKNELRKDIVVYEEKLGKKSKVCAKIKLNRLEAMILRFRMFLYNANHPCVMKLKSYKGKHVRV